MHTNVFDGFEVSLLKQSTKNYFRPKNRQLNEE